MRGMLSAWMSLCLRRGVNLWTVLIVCCSLQGCGSDRGDPSETGVQQSHGLATSEDSRQTSSGRLRIGQVLGQALDQGVGSGQDDADAFLLADEVRTLHFPIDHGAHPQYQTEWWYLTGVLRHASGREFGFQYTLFRYGLFKADADSRADAWRNGQMYMAHLALSDVEAEQHHSTQRLVRGHPRLAGVATDPWMRTWLEDWHFNQLDRTRFSLRAQEVGHFGRGHFGQGHFGLELQLTQERPMRLQGDGGLSHKGEDSASYYYSLPRLAASGTIVIAGEPYQVTGRAWLDREWSTSVLEEGVRGWSWFALHFDSKTPLAGHDLMAFSMQREDGTRHTYDHGQLSNATEARVLTLDDFELHPLEYWTDATGGRWPIAWQLRLKKGLSAAQDGARFKVEAVFNDQLMDDSFVYWEGMVVVRDDEGARVGDGYMELTGYQGGD